MRRSVRLLLSGISGVLLSLPWLGFPGWILFVAFLPLWALDDFFVSRQEQYKGVSFWGHAFFSFLVWNGLTTWWILHATPAGAFVAIFLNAFLMSLVFWLGHAIRRQAGNSAGYLAFVVFWISFEYAHYHWEIEWPWLTLGNGFADNISLIQWYSATGVFGGSLWVLTVGILLFLFLKAMVTDMAPRTRIVRATGTLVVWLVPVFVSLFIYHGYEEKGKSARALIVQPNIDPYTETHDQAAVNEKLMKFIQIAEAHMTPDVEYIVGPETVFEENWDEAFLMGNPAFHQLSLLTRMGSHCSLVIGASTYRIYKEGDQVSPTARRSANGLVYDVYNSAIFTDSRGGYQVYHKSILVPGVEKMPFRKYLKFLDSFIIDLGGTTGSLGVQDEPANFTAVDGSMIAPAICYESAFGGYMARFVKKGAQVIFVITNDGWWKDTPGYRQHFSFSRLRAVETRRCIVRAANTGISGFINQRGDILQKSEWWTEDALPASVRFNDELTFYVKHGDSIARISLFMTILLLLNGVVTRLRTGKKNRTSPDCVKPRLTGFECPDA